MWVFLSDAMLSIVEKPGDAKDGTLTVRARIAGDIERVFPEATVTEGAGTDYRFRATIPRALVARTMHDLVMSISYANFKSTVKDHQRHDVYMQVWSALYRLQEKQVK